MKTYQVKVVMSYWQTIEVNAENEDDACEIAYDSFDVTKADQGEGEIMGVEISG